MSGTTKQALVYLGNLGSSLPAAIALHRGNFYSKRANGSEDELYAGMRDSSGVMRLRRLLTKTYGDTLYVPLIQSSMVNPYTVDPTIANSAVTGSTTSTTDYSVNVQNAAFALPAGTWDVYAWGAGLFAHSAANGIVRVHLQVGSDAGTALTVACAQDPGGRTSVWRTGQPARPARSSFAWNTVRIARAPRSPGAVG